MPGRGGAASSRPGPVSPRSDPFLDHFSEEDSLSQDGARGLSDQDATGNAVEDTAPNPVSDALFAKLERFLGAAPEYTSTSETFLIPEGSDQYIEEIRFQGSCNKRDVVYLKQKNGHTFRNPAKWQATGFHTVKVAGPGVCLGRFTKTLSSNEQKAWLQLCKTYTTFRAERCVGSRNIEKERTVATGGGLKVMKKALPKGKAVPKGKAAAARAQPKRKETYTVKELQFELLPIDESASIEVEGAKKKEEKGKSAGAKANAKAKGKKKERLLPLEDEDDDIMGDESVGARKKDAQEACPNADEEYIFSVVGFLEFLCKLQEKKGSLQKIEEEMSKSVFQLTSQNQNVSTGVKDATMPIKVLNRCGKQGDGSMLGAAGSSMQEDQDDKAGNKGSGPQTNHREFILDEDSLEQLRSGMNLAGATCRQMHKRDDHTDVSKHFGFESVLDADRKDMASRAAFPVVRVRRQKKAELVWSLEVLNSVHYFNDLVEKVRFPNVRFASALKIRRRLFLPCLICLHR